MTDRVAQSVVELTGAPDVAELERGGVPLVREDWRDLPAPDRDELLDEYLREDRLRGASGLPRAALFRLDGDRHLLVRTTLDAAAGAAVHERLAALAASAPDALALCCGRERLTYAELNERGDRLAGALRALGAGAESRVGLCVERSVDLVVGQLGVLKAGAAFVPLDPGTPPARRAAMLADARACAQLTRGLELERLDHGGAAGPLPHRGELAYVVFTSGSTGRPKGVEIEHGGLTSRAAWGGLHAGDRASQVANPSFDISVWEIWSCLSAGASLHLPDEETRTSPARLAAWLRDQAITVSFLPTPLAELVLEQPWPPGAALRTLFVGGDRLHRVRQAGLPFRLVNLYGPTEVTIISTSAVVATGPDGDELPPIGRPIADTAVHVVDGKGRPAVEGELLIGGAALARGYCGRPDLTAASFVPDPFGARPGARLYRSGDLVRTAPDGTLQFLGRLDHQVKVRGVRVEPGEIEAALLREPGVTAAVAVAAGQRLVAYVAPRVETGALRAALARTLPGPMVPAVIVALDELPLTANGKVDRAALPPPDARALPAVAPRSPLEASVAALWAELLGLEPAAVGVEDDFFRLGGHSVLAMQLVLRIAETVGVDVPLRAVFEAPTVAALCARIEPGAARPAAIARLDRDTLRMDRA